MKFFNLTTMLIMIITIARMSHHEGGCTTFLKKTKRLVKVLSNILSTKEVEVTGIYRQHLF